MIKILRFVLGLCNHAWVIHSELDVYNKFGDPMPYARTYHQQCTRCGALRRKKI